MQKVTIEDITLKLTDLSSGARKELFDFMNFLISRQRKRKKISKDKLLKVSSWSESDIKAIENAGRELNRWSIAKF